MRRRRKRELTENRAGITLQQDQAILARGLWVKSRGDERYYCSNRAY